MLAYWPSRPGAIWCLRSASRRCRDDVPTPTTAPGIAVVAFRFAVDTRAGSFREGGGRCSLTEAAAVERLWTARQHAAEWGEAVRDGVEHSRHVLRELLV